MGLIEKINADIKIAMLAREKEKLQALRDIKSKFIIETTSGNGDLSEGKAIAIILKLYKQRIDTYNLYIKEGRQDLAQEEKFQADVISSYMPEMMSEEEIKNEVLMVISETGASGIQDMGKVMGILSKKLSGKADGKIIANTVKSLLNNK